MTEKEIKTELDYLMTLRKVSGSDLNRLYKVYKIISKDNGYLCTRCSRVVRKVFNWCKNYYNQKYK